MLHHHTQVWNFMQSLSYFESHILLDSAPHSSLAAVTCALLRPGAACNPESMPMKPKVLKYISL